MKDTQLKLGWFSTSRGETSLKIFKYIQTLIERKKLNNFVVEYNYKLIIKN